MECIWQQLHHAPNEQVTRLVVTCCDAFFIIDCDITRFLCTMHVFKVRASFSPLGYLCAKFRFFRSLHCWAGPWRKIAYSITRSPTQLIWCPGNQSFCFGMSMSISNNSISVTVGLAREKHSTFYWPAFMYFLYQMQVCLINHMKLTGIPGNNDIVVIWAGQRTSDSQVMASSPDWAPLCSGFEQATYTCVPLSPSSIIWYQPRGWSLWLGK